MKGNEDRRGPVVGHAKILDGMRRAVDSAIESDRSTRLDLALVLGWLMRTGVTGYYQTERDRAAQSLLDARDAARQVSEQLDLALAAMQRVP
jgi:hypothetical protein